MPSPASSSNDPASKRAGVQDGGSGGFEPGWMWEALTQDTAAAVMVLTAGAEIEFANDHAARIFQMEVGKGSLDGVMGSEIGRERAAAVRDCATTGTVKHIHGMIKGRSLICTLRATGDGRVLWVSRLASPSDPEAEAVPAPGVKARANDAGRLAVLTSRELDILKLVGLGLSSAEIAKRLSRSIKTIEWHRVALGEKLGVSNRVELARIAIASGLVSPEQADRRQGSNDDLQGDSRG